jgi:tetratricopeptide (TPR) repeat protein
MSKKVFGPTVLVAIGLIFIAVIGFRTISTPEIWTHLAQGRTNAPISYLASDVDINTTWLYDKLAYTAWNIGGPNLLIALNIAGLLATFILLLQVSKKWGGPLSQGFALLIAGHLIFQSVDTGPETIMILFIAATLYLVSTLEKPALLFGTLIPLQILWTNMHSSFIYGALIAALAAIQAVQQSKGAGGRRRKLAVDAKTYGILAGAMLIATIANPYLFKLHGQVVASLKMGAPAYWSSLYVSYFQIPMLRPLTLFVMVLGAGGLITLKKKLPATLTGMALYGAFLALTSPQGMALLFAVLSFPFIVLSLTAISEYIHNSLEHMLGKQAKLLMPATSLVYILLIALSLVPMATNCAYISSGSASSFGMGINDELYPNDAEDIINDPAFPDKVINLAADGGYLAFNYNRKIFIDYRPGRYDKELLSDLSNLMLGNQEAYDRIYEIHRPEAFIINTLYPVAAQGIATLLSKDIWKLVYFDGTTAILLHNKEEFADILNNTSAQKAGLAKLERARAEYASRIGSCSAGNPSELIGASKVYLAFNRLTESKALFSLLLQNNDRIPAAWIGLGESQLRLKEYETAVESLRTATALAPKNPQALRAYAGACIIASQRLKDSSLQSAYKAEANVVIEKIRQLDEQRGTPEEELPDPEEEIPVEQTSLEDLQVPESL